MLCGLSLLWSQSFYPFYSDHNSNWLNISWEYVIAAAMDLDGHFPLRVSLCCLIIFYVELLLPFISCHGYDLIKDHSLIIINYSVLDC